MGSCCKAIIVKIGLLYIQIMVQLVGKILKFKIDVLQQKLTVACFGNNWVVGKGNNHMIAYSTDNAETWTHSLMEDGSNTDTLFTIRGNTVTTNGSRWIAGGCGTSNGDFMLLGYSDNNGQTWVKLLILLLIHLLKYLEVIGMVINFGLEVQK